MLDRFASILERRFLLNAFLPVALFIGGYVWLLEWATGRLTEDLRAWSASSTSTKFLIGAAFFGLVWFGAGFLSNQWRNIIRLYEGYHFRGPFKVLAKLGVAAHLKRQESMRSSAQVTYQEYPGYSWDVLPTRLGNVLRAAERYPSQRYGADYLVLWTRLGHLVPQRVLNDMEDYRAALEFLVVAATGFATFGCVGALTCAVTGHGPMLFLGLLAAGAILAYAAYSAAIQTAKAYGEAMRASFDLFRNELLMRMRWPIPVDATEERATWEALSNFIRLGLPRVTPYAKAWVDVDPERLY